MKIIKIISIGFLLLFGTIITRAQEDSDARVTTLQFYNNTGEDIFVAIAFYDKDNEGWSSKGWWTVPSYKEFDLNLGSYTGRVYVHGE